jgi:membrane associated rhomboid family serine protease
MDALITYIIIGFTCLISIPAFSNEKLINDMIFYPPAVKRGQWYRFITCGFIHADYMHLIFNMLSLFFIGPSIERNFSGEVLFGGLGKTTYLLLYVTALIASLLPTYLKNVNNHYYRSLGASGAVSAIVFVFIFLFPSAKLSLMFIPIGVPGFIYGIVYLAISTYLERRGTDNVNHSAHIWGALYGMLFLIVAGKMAGFDAIKHFVSEIQQYLGK